MQVVSDLPENRAAKEADRFNPAGPANPAPVKHSARINWYEQHIVIGWSIKLGDNYTIMRNPGAGPVFTAAYYWKIIHAGKR